MEYTYFRFWILDYLDIIELL